MYRGAGDLLPTLGSDVETQAAIGMLVASAEVWLAERGPELVGLLVLERDHIAHLYVAPADQNRGLGSRLLELAKQRRPRHLDLLTAERNLAARRFYERHGFRLRGAVGADLRYDWAPEPA